MKKLNIDWALYCFVLYIGLAFVTFYIRLTPGLDEKVQIGLLIPATHYLAEHPALFFLSLGFSRLTRRKPKTGLFVLITIWLLTTSIEMLTKPFSYTIVAIACSVFLIPLLLGYLVYRIYETRQISRE